MGFSEQALSESPDEQPADTAASSDPPPKSAAIYETRQLPTAEDTFADDGARISFALRSDVGRARGNNEDSAVTLFLSSQTVDTLPDFGVFIVADGMGGQNEGERASMMAVKQVTAEVSQKIYVPILSGESLNDIPPINEILVQALEKANDAIHEVIDNGGTTCTAAVMLGRRAYIAHVGDSRAYLITRDGIEQITHDHSVTQTLTDMGQLTKEEARQSEYNSVLYRALGHDSRIEVDAFSRSLPAPCKLLLCSDGLWNMVNEEEILNLTRRFPAPAEACEKLINLANSRGGPDNITVVILRVN